MKTPRILSFFFTVFCLSTCLFGTKVHPRGYWQGTDACLYHFFDIKLAPALVQFFQEEDCTSVVDLGCGMADYVKYLRCASFKCDGYDGNPNTPQLTQGIGKVLDLSRPVVLDRQYDWVLSIEVGEHIPHKYERVFIENLVRNCRCGIVLSWGEKGQGGHGHVNEQDNNYIKERMEEYGLYSDLEAEAFLRKNCCAGWLKKTIMVFRKL